MKNLGAILLILTCVVALFSCKKDATKPVSYSLLGKWNVVTDSLNVSFLNTQNRNYYTGVVGDYYDFRADSKLYLKEGSKLDTFSYTLLADTGVVISTFGIVLNGSLSSCTTKITANSAKITTVPALTPGGFVWRSVRLSR